MADERYEWLDQDTAERLLRGEPVGALGEPARAEAVRLDRALRDAAPDPAPAAGELPGEAAALAAFRAARTPAGARTDAEDRAIGVVRIGAVSRSRRRRTRLSSPFRFGVVAVVAGFAFGGVAVASGGDLLPSPFGNASPSGGDASAGTGSDAVTDRSSDEHSGAPSRGPHRPSSTAGARSGAPKGPGEGLSAEGKRAARAAELHLKALHACGHHRAGTLDAKGRQLLAVAAKGRDRIDAYCTARLAEATPSHPGAGNGSGNGNVNGGGRGNQGATAPNGPGKGNGPGTGGGPGTGNGAGSSNGAGTANGNPHRGPGEQNDRGKGNENKKKDSQDRDDKGDRGGKGSRAWHGSQDRDGDDHPEGHDRVSGYLYGYDAGPGAGTGFDLQV
ncbi:hypothetical protein ACH41E_11945 [Streptomyces sp. NPDC020412]|uniref:hypothetical protein n=1 Tax=Streptomyces sp. NPDC020412 TaxID=3365073 RepID=UPI0037B0911A